MITDVPGMTGARVPIDWEKARAEDDIASILIFRFGLI